jgi:hypothetical protein
MIPSPFVSEDYLQSRLALPFHNPLVKPFMKIGINAYKPMYPKSIQLPKASPALQPMPPVLK